MSDCEDLTSRLEDSLVCMKICGMKWIRGARKYLAWLHEMERLARREETDSGSWLDHAREYELLKEKRGGFFEWCVEMEKVSDSLVEAGHNEDRPIAYKAWRRDMEREMVRLDEKDSQRWHENAFNHVALKQERENFSKWCLEMGIDSVIAVDVYSPSAFEDDGEDTDSSYDFIGGEADEVIKDSDAFISDDVEDNDDYECMIGADDDEDDDDSDAMIDADDEEDDDDSAAITDKVFEEMDDLSKEMMNVPTAPANVPATHVNEQAPPDKIYQEMDDLSKGMMNVPAVRRRQYPLRLRRDQRRKRRWAHLKE